MHHKLKGGRGNLIMQKRPYTGQHWIWAGVLTAALLAACGGGEKPDAGSPPPKALTLQLHGPAQVRPGEALQITGSQEPGSAAPATMEWQLLERPAGSQASLPTGQSSSQWLSTDRPGRYVVQWAVVATDGTRAQQQIAVEAVDGPLIELSAPTGQLQLGQSTLLQASLPAAESPRLASYRWTLLNGPGGSRAQLSAAWGSEVSLKADVAGAYQVRVEATQGDTVTSTLRTIQATAAEPPRIYASFYCSFLTGCDKVVGAPVNLFTFVIGTLGNAQVDYRWSLQSLPPGSRLSSYLGRESTATFTPDVVGSYLVEMSPTSFGLNFWPSYIMINVVPKPTGRLVAPSTVLVGQVATLDGTANRTSGGQALSNLSRSWTLVSAPKGSSAVIQASSNGELKATLRPDRSGDYVVSLGVDSVPGYATATVHANAADPKAIYPPLVSVPLSPALPGEEVQLKAESASEAGNPIVHEWKFGDGASATGDNVSHRFAYPGVYQLQVLARDTVTQRTARQLATVTVVASRLDNIPPAHCGQETCAAAAPNRYAGPGAGRWQLSNELPHTQAVNIDIAGVPAGRQVFVSLTNASGDDAGLAELGQSEGMTARKTQTSTVQPAGVSQAQAPITPLNLHDRAHAEHLAGDNMLASVLRASGPAKQAQAGRRRVQSASERPALPVPELGSNRDWRDAPTGSYYKTRLVDNCSLPNGRNVLFWLDEQARTGELVGPEQIAQDLKPMACGEKGGFQRLQQLLQADVFGLHDRTEVISDAALQPVQIVLADPGPNIYWGAYVSSGNLLQKWNWSGSNEAVMMVVNTRYIKTDLNFIKSALVHEYMHLVNFYQRLILNRSLSHESWLEETTAMMAEDLISSSLINKPDGSRFAALAMRMMNYQSLSWTAEYLGASYADYSVGGSLAGYLDRRLGAGLLRALTFDCRDDGQSADSLHCLDEQLFRVSGKGLVEHYGAMNSSVIGRFNAADGIDLGAPSYVDADVDLPEIDLRSLQAYPYNQLTSAWRLLPGSHVYQWEITTDAAGGRYRRKGIMVPPGHVLQIVIR